MKNSVKGFLDALEQRLVDFYISLPQLADYIEEPVFRYLPVITVALGLLALYDSYALWHSAHSVNSLIIYTNNYGGAYGVPKVPIDSHMGLAFWLSLFTLLIEAYLFLKAYPLVKRQLKSGWNLIYYAFVLNVVYGIIMLFSYYGGLTGLIERVIVSLFCLYFLFEIRDHYLTPKERAEVNKVDVTKAEIIKPEVKTSKKPKKKPATKTTKKVAKQTNKKPKSS